MSDIEGYNFLSTKEPNPIIGSTRQVQGTSTSEIAYCRPCMHHGYELSLVSENLGTPVCLCKPHCRSVVGLRPRNVKGDERWNVAEFEGICEFIPPDQEDSIVTGKLISQTQP